ncbi:hypothetical protein PR202_ga29459 [Eleusine coracana subsp. coracana]|uniref:Transmembrane protein n=1 Tax=Eleusine coracana subsp. coracana TaxID=191504 RepID=A0AAV5DM80_ELECO|nr:hypothetical protein PR202_ga29459 [Eleusine coracana subsp. coracana]
MDRDPSVSDEDDDLETLVPQNHTKPQSPTARSRSPASSFSVSALRPALPSAAASIGRALWSRRYLILFVALPLLFLILFLSLGGASSLPASIRLPSAGPATDPAASRMREAELHALYLLRYQRSGAAEPFQSHRAHQRLRLCPHLALRSPVGAAEPDQDQPRDPGGAPLRPPLRDRQCDGRRTGS